MTTTITIVSNGDVHGDGVYIPMDDYHAFLEEWFATRYPDAIINVSGDARTDGGNTASMTTEPDDDYTDLHEETQQAYSAACDAENLWFPIEEE